MLFIFNSFSLKEKQTWEKNILSSPISMIHTLKFYWLQPLDSFHCEDQKHKNHTNAGQNENLAHKKLETEKNIPALFGFTRELMFQMKKHLNHFTNNERPQRRYSVGRHTHQQDTETKEHLSLHIRYDCRQPQTFGQSFWRKN